MTNTTDPSTRAVVVVSHDDVLLARATVRTARAAGHLACTVVDVDGAYRPVAGERVVSLHEVVTRLDLTSEAATAAATLQPEDFSFYVGVLGATHALVEDAGGVVVLGAGVHVLADLRPLVDDTDGVVVVPFADAHSAQRRAAAAPINLRREPRTGQLTISGAGAGPLYSRALYVVHTLDQVEVLRDLAGDWRAASLALDTCAATVDATVVSRQPVLVGPWRGVGTSHVDADGRLRIDGVAVQAVDLTAFDARRPWVLDAQATTNPSVLLTEHPALARLVSDEAKARIVDQEMLDPPQADELLAADKPARVRLDAVLRSEARRTELAGGELPDLLGLGVGADLETWALALVPAGDPMPVTRYLAAVRQARADVQHVFRQVPGPDAPGLARWATKHGVGEPGLDRDLLVRGAEITLAALDAATAAAKGPRVPGVNLIGYLAGELGLGVSARLVDSALEAAEISTSTFDVGRDLESRQGARFRRAESVVHDTSLLCVNAAETPEVAPRLKTLLKNTRVIGMWYWELEDFPETYAPAFAHVDEVWAATDFMRDAIAQRSGDVPVRTVMPPLPQAGEDPGVVPERFGIPADRPWFLFTFDYFSSAVRKNPFGLVEAFTRAFADQAMDQRPLLVIKTINAVRDPVQAERLRFQVALRTDVMVLDAYLDNHERHVLVSHCTAYVSLHRAEGLGLTVAEAMAWGKPVITTAYGGVMQFCTQQNSFLVDWERSYIEETVGPYEKGLAWAEPDLDHAAELMRAVIDDPARAATVGAQAARDVREVHSAQLAGARIREVLDEGRVAWQAERAESRAQRRTQRRANAGPTEAASPLDGRVRRLAAAARTTVQRRVEAAMSRRARP